MAVEVFPDSPSAAMSPRISFSHDLPQNDIVPIEHYVRSSTSSSIDFDFCVFGETLDQDQSSSADELFSDGKILPIEIKKRLLAAPLRSSAAAPPPLPPSLPPPPRATYKANIEEKQNQKTSSFWRFKRSASLNCGSGYATSLCPLPLMSRSNSTGSTASVKRSSSNNQKQSFQKYALPNAPLKQSWSTNYHKPPLKKSGYCYNGGPRINPVLNVPSANLFGLASIFSGAKDKAKKK